MKANIVKVKRHPKGYIICELDRDTHTDGFRTVEASAVFVFDRGMEKLLNAGYPGLPEDDDIHFWSHDPINVRLFINRKGYLNLETVAPILGEYSDVDPDVPQYHLNLESAKVYAQKRARLVLNSDFVVFDTETRGLDVPEIIQVGMVDPTGKVLLNDIVKPIHPVNESAYAIHNIDTEKTELTFPDIYPKLKDLMDGKVWVGYNVAFDVKALNVTCMLHNLPLLVPKSVHCVMHDIAVYYHPDYRTWDYYSKSHNTTITQGGFVGVKLVELAELHSIKSDNAHDALADVYMTLDLLRGIAGDKTDSQGRKANP